MDDKKFLILSLVAIALLGVGLYANSLDGAFVWDDQHLITDNPLVKKGDAFKLFQGNILAGYGKKSHAYRPLQMLTYLVDYRLWKLETRGYHVTSLLWHVLAALCVFGLAYRLSSDRLLALFAGLLFVSHPVHTEAVSYISGRSDPMAAVFLLASFLAYIDRDLKRALPMTVAAAAAYAAALLCREASLALPVLLLAYHLTFREKIDENRFLSLIVLTGLYVLGRAVAVQDLLSDPGNLMTFKQRLFGFFAALSQYAGLLVWPAHLHMEYGLPRLPLTDLRVVSGIVLLAAVVFVAWSAGRRNKVASFSLQWFLIALLPVSNLFPVNAYMAEHWLYLPSIGFFLLVAQGLRSLWARRALQPAALAVFLGAMAASSLLTRAQNLTWVQPQAFYERTLRYAPDSIRAAVNLANIYQEKGRTQEAEELYKKVLAASPDDAMALSNLANIYRERGRPQEAEALYEEAMEAEPGYELSYNNQGNIYEDSGQHEEAILMYKKAIEVNPQYAGSYYNLGNVYQNMGQFEEAITWYEKAIEFNPDFPDTYNNLGNAYKRLGDVEKAIATYEKAIALKPDFLEAHNNLGTAYLRLGKHEEAIESLKKAIALDPDYAVAYVNLAVVSYDAGDFEAAVRYADEAQRLGGEAHPEFLKLLEPYRKKEARPIVIPAR